MLHALPILLAFTTVVSTFLGGLFAIKARDRLHRILGFTAGVLLGVVAFDLLPEIFHLTQETSTAPIVPMIALVIGFLAFHVVEKLAIVHSSHEHVYERGHKHPYVGVMSGLALSFHSFFDGVGIGLAFQANTALGIAVALAVIAHDFCDGMNTVMLMLINGNSPRQAFKLLIVDAIAPVAGAASTLLFSISDRWMLLYLGSFAGFLLYIGASDILPEAHSVQPSYSTLALTVAGVVLIYFVATMGL